MRGGVQAVTAGLDFTCAPLTTGAVRCRGSNHDGRLGNGVARYATTAAPPR
ncbi:MAG: hypothetical protein JW940_03305 [Polyangiaceae bacterium]|nr:hypothetical protein [Polyangiaceae bacterium]